MEKVIFLDFDGVINNNKEDVTIKAIEALKRLIMVNNARVVIISSRIRNGLEESRIKAQELLNSYGIFNIDFLDFNFEGVFLDKDLDKKTLGIIDYLKANEVLEYVILDDENARNYKYTGLNYFKTAMWVGLTNEDLTKIKFKAPLVKTLNLVRYHRISTERENKERDLIRVLKRILKVIEHEKQN